MYNKEIKISKKLLNGYQWFWDTEHPLSFGGGRVYVHRHVMSLHLGRWVDSNEHIHHINEDRSDNRIENLEIVSPTEHIHIHHGKKTLVKCEVCGEYTDNKKYCSIECLGISKRIVKRPSKKELINMINNSSYVAIGKRYGVSDVAVRKWAKSYGII